MSAMRIRARAGAVALALGAVAFGPQAVAVATAAPADGTAGAAAEDSRPATVRSGAQRGVGGTRTASRAARKSQQTAKTASGSVRAGGTVDLRGLPNVGRADVPSGHEPGAAEIRRSAEVAAHAPARGAAGTPGAVLADSDAMSGVTAPPQVTPVAGAVAAVRAGDVVSGILSGLANLFGVSPVPGTFYDLAIGALDAMRRQIRGYQFKTAPTASPVQYGQTPDRQIIGTVGAIDAEGDRLSYAVTQAPQHGTVVVSSDGTYTYSPESTFAKTGGTDTFTIGVIESHLPVKSSLESLFGRTTDVPVTVTVNPSPSRPLLGASYTERVWVMNWTSGVMTYEEAGGSGKADAPDVALDSQPVKGTQYAPGDFAIFELKREFNTTNQAVLLFNIAYPGDQAPVEVRTWVTTTGWTGDVQSSCSTGTDSGLGCGTLKDGSLTYFLDPPGTTYEVPASQKDQQAELLAKCGKSADCTFTVKSPATSSTPYTSLTKWKQLSADFRNSKRNYQMAVKDVMNPGVSFTQTTETSVAISGSAGVSWLAAIEVQAQYTKSWSTSTTVQNALFVDLYGVPDKLADGTVLPVGTARVGALWALEPVKRIYLDATVKSGNTTWNLRDLWQDYPDPDRPTGLEVKLNLVLPDGTVLPGDDVPPA